MITRQLFLDRARLVPGWITEKELSFLAEIASESNTIFEIGTYCGKSTMAMAENSSDKCKIYCIDPWDYSILWSNNTIQVIDETVFGIFYCGLADHIRSKKVIPNITTWDKFIPPIDVTPDFIFIDGDHSYKSVKNDIIKALKLIHPRGIISGHDHHWVGVQKAVSEFFPKVQLEDSIWTARRF